MRDTSQKLLNDIAKYWESPVQNHNLSGFAALMLTQAQLLLQRTEQLLIPQLETNNTQDSSLSYVLKCKCGWTSSAEPFSVRCEKCDEDTKSTKPVEKDNLLAEVKAGLQKIAKYDSPEYREMSIVAAGCEAKNLLERMG